VRRNAEFVSARATEVFGNHDKAQRWLRGIVPSLGNRTPASLLATAEGIAEVQDTLGAIEHGIW
jgi:putative toxin-antitoxin system antitoxin component (TIGR02293 family)